MTNVLLNTATEAMSFAERMKYGLEVFVVGVGTVFTVLVILWLALIAFRVFAYDIPQKKAKQAAEKAVEATPAAELPVSEPETINEEAPQDDSELIAVISAAIVAYDVRSGSSLPCRVVSFKRVSGANGWNSK